MMRALVIVMLVAGVASAQPGGSPESALREANDAATAGDWSKVDQLIQPLLGQQLDRADLGEAHRLAGIAAMFAQPPRRDIAEQHFLAYLKIDLDGHLDPALYPPEVVTFFNDVKARHASELKAQRPKKRYAVLSLLPPFGQFQNGERTKGWVLAGMMGSFFVADATAIYLRYSWCTHVTSSSGHSSYVCDGHYEGGRATRSIQIAATTGLLLTYLYGVYDGVRGYRRESRERALMPFASPTNNGGVVGVWMNF